MCYRNLAIGEDQKCFIELNTKQLTGEQIQEVERTCNDYIRSCIPVEPRWLQSDDPELEQVNYNEVIRYVFKLFS